MSKLNRIQRHRLNKYAKESFDKMKADAKEFGGVDLIILPGSGAADRTKAQANEACAGKGQSAVACFPNSHNLGLAVDLRWDRKERKYCEACTDTYEECSSYATVAGPQMAVLKHSNYGWYPYTNEPWHWEYNPKPDQANELWSEDFRTKYFEGSPAPPP